MTARLAAGVLVSALVRRVNAEGGHATVLARGDATAGAVLIVCADRGAVTAVRERVLGPESTYLWQPVGGFDPNDPAAVTDYVARRQRSDPDLWVIELDIPNAERFAAGMTGDA